MATQQYIANLCCDDHPGIVRDVASFIAGSGGNVTQSAQFADETSGRFFMRTQFSMPGEARLERIREGFTMVGASHGMDWRIVEAGQRARLLVMVSQYGHCLNDLLFRTRSGAINAQIALVVSNHESASALCEAYGVPFHYLPITPETKATRERELLELVDSYEIDLVVLARYMQILSPDLCARLSARIINIHHSFLPSFKGARPYHQAHARGVNLIGATAHYVTADLEEGPIIEQEVTRVDHSHSPEQLAQIGRDVECSALARAVGWHVEDRIILDDGHRTVVFR